MLTIAIDKNNDLFLDNNGNIAFKSDLDAMGDIYVNKAQTNKGELVYNTEKGIDFFNTVFGEPFYPDVFQYQLLNELQDTAETQKISGYKQEITNNILKYSVDCYTSYGIFTLNG